MPGMIRTISTRARRAIERFTGVESASGTLLLLATLLALVIANSPWAADYHRLLSQKAGVTLPVTDLHLTLLHWINDGLMAVFFLLVTLEIKREFLEGHFERWQNALMPLIAALGGMLAPAAIYLAISRNHPALHAGWAVPTATDIAFALGVLGLMGRRAPLGLKVLLTAIAILDDLGAILIIALAYTRSVSPEVLAMAVLLFGGMLLLGRLRVARLWPYLLLAPLLWLLVLKSGVHATLAGVAVGLAIPMRGRNAQSPLKHLEHRLHPWVAFGIVPLFAFANAGLSMTDLSARDFLHPLPAGIAFGLFAGKAAGVFLAVWAARRSGLAALPDDVRMAHVFGMALLCGIGFTMSLFIGALAFEDVAHMNLVRLGVLSGSALSAVAGLLWLSRLRSAPF